MFRLAGIRNQTGEPATMPSENTVRIAIEEGAQIHSKVEITRGEDSQGNRSSAKSSGPVPANVQSVAMKAGGDAAN